MITVRKANYSLSDLRDLRVILSDGYDKFVYKKCSHGIACKSCNKYYLCHDIISTLNHLDKTIDKLELVKN